MPDVHKNFGYSTIAVAPIPATSGTAITVQSGDGAKFPTVPFNATVWVTGANPLTTNAEIVRVTLIVADVLTIVRAQEGSSARTIVTGDQIAATITAKTLTDAELANTDVTLAADRTINLNGKIFHVAQGGNVFLLIDPTTNAESAALVSFNPTGSDNVGGVVGFTTDVSAQVSLVALFNGVTKVASVELESNATNTTAVYKADTHTFPILGGSGVGVAAVDNTGKLSWSAGPVNNPLMVQIFG